MKKGFFSNQMFSTKQKFVFGLIIIFIAGLNHKANGYADPVIYVKKGAPISGDGSSWSNAYPDLQSALTRASSTPGSDEIWVSLGEYKPTDKMDRTISFLIPSGTSLYGGFKGTETTRIERDALKNRTLLSGDIGMSFIESDNSYHVVIINAGTSSVIDGFIIKNGNANGAAGALYNNSGGGMAILASSEETSLSVQNCKFLENKASYQGGAVIIVSDVFKAGPKFINCEFNGNTAQIGGGVANLKKSGIHTPEILNCIFSSNKATQSGGAISNIGSDAVISNCKLVMNQGLNSGGGVYNSGGAPQIKNNILWKNFKGTYGSTLAYNQIENNDQSSAVIQNNTIQGGYGVPNDLNSDIDPSFVREPSFVGKFPRTSIIPIQQTPSYYESQMVFEGPRSPGHQTYFTYKDHSYNKLYIFGVNVQIIDFNNLTNNLPTSKIYDKLVWGRIQRLENSIHNNGNRIYFSTAERNLGIVSIDRQTGEQVVFDPLADEGITRTYTSAQDIVIDNKNNLLYSPIFYSPGEKFYGLLELNLLTNAKRWITNNSSPIALPVINNASDRFYWNGHRLFLDEQENILYYSMGKGVWWWNRTTNKTGIYDTSGGMPLMPGNPNLPSNLTTHIFIDKKENKLYIGTHNGLFVWDRNNNTSKIYNKDNSLMIHNLVDHIDKNDDENILYVACEEGGLFTINTKTGEQHLFLSGSGSPVKPELVDTQISSSYFDKIDKKLYVSAWGLNAGVWIMDYRDLVPDYGDLNLKTVICGNPILDFQSELQDSTFIFTPIVKQLDKECTMSYSWNFGDNTTSTEISPRHKYASTGTYNVSLKIEYQCDKCPAAQILSSHTITNQKKPCENLYCGPNGTVGIATSVVPNGYTLAVSGKAIMEGATLDMQADWPDYVFDQGYELIPLLDLNKYIKLHRHLPSIPSAKTIKKQGIDVGEMNALLLQKVEELTLYFIMLDEQLKKLESPNSSIIKKAKE